jgi:hypothetical protein
LHAAHRPEPTSRDPVLDIRISGVDRLAASRTHRDSCSISMRDILPVPGPFLPASLWIPPGRLNLSPGGHSAKRAHRARFIAVANRGGSALGAEMFVPRAGPNRSERICTRVTPSSWRARPRWSQGDREGEPRLTPPPSGALVLVAPRPPPTRSSLTPPFRHQPQTFSNSRSTRSPETPSFERGAARETCVFSYAPACFSACAGTPQTIRSGGVVR